MRRSEPALALVGEAVVVQDRSLLVVEGGGRGGVVLTSVGLVVEGTGGTGLRCSSKKSIWTLSRVMGRCTGAGTPSFALALLLLLPVPVPVLKRRLLLLFRCCGGGEAAAAATAASLQLLLSCFFRAVSKVST